MVGDAGLLRQPRLPLEHLLLDHVPERPVDKETQKPQHDHVEEDHVHHVEGVVVPKTITETAPGAGSEHLRGDDTHPGDPHGYSDPRGDGGEGGGEGHVPDQVAAPGAAEDHRRLHIDPGYVPEPYVGVDQYGKDRAHEYYEACSLWVQAEPDYGEGDPGQGRDGTDQLHDGIEDPVCRLGPPHAHPYGHGHHQSRDHSDEEVEQADWNVHIEDILPVVLQALCHLDEAGKYQGLVDGHGQKLPCHHQDQDREDLDPVFLHCPSGLLYDIQNESSVL